MNTDEKPPMPPLDTLVTCGPGEGLPAADWNPVDGWWAYCEPALGNGPVEEGPLPVTEQVIVHKDPPAGITELPATGFDPVLLVMGLVLVALGAGSLVKGRR